MDAASKLMSKSAHNLRASGWAVLILILGSIYHSAWNLQLPSLPNENGSKLSPIHVAFGLSGNRSGFLSEFEVALKSVLLNAPTDRDLAVHVLADRDAYLGAGQIFDRTDLSSWVARNPIEIHAYDVTPHIPSLERRIVDTYNGTMRPDFRLHHATWIHTIGCFFRLIVHRVVPPLAKHVLYMDTDVVIMANLEEVWRQVEARPDALFHWGAIMCSGFVVLNVARMDEIWSIAKGAPLKNISEANRKQKPNDQLLFVAVNVTRPEEVNVLAGGWDMTVTGRWTRDHRPYDEKFPDVGMLHLNGGRDDEAYFAPRNAGFLETFPGTWGNARRYVATPWTWARYQARSLVRPGEGGHPLRICAWGRGGAGPANSSSSGCERF